MEGGISAPRPSRMASRAAQATASVGAESAPGAATADAAAGTKAARVGAGRRGRPRPRPARRASPGLSSAARGVLGSRRPSASWWRAVRWEATPESRGGAGAASTRRRRRPSPGPKRCAARRSALGSRQHPCPHLAQPVPRSAAAPTPGGTRTARAARGPCARPREAAAGVRAGAGAGAGARRRRRRPDRGRGRGVCRTLDRSSGAAAAAEREPCRAPGQRCRAAARIAEGAERRSRRLWGKPAPLGLLLPVGSPGWGRGRAVWGRGSPAASALSRTPPAAIRTVAAAAAAAAGGGCCSGGALAAARGRGRGRGAGARPGCGPRGQVRGGCGGQGGGARQRFPPGAEHHLVFHADPKGQHASRERPRLLPGAAAGSVSWFFPSAGRLGAQGRGPQPGAQRHHGHGAVPVPQLPEGHAV